MAIVLGTNAGFVTVAPTSAPAGAFQATVAGRAAGLKDTTPVGAGKIVEIGVWNGYSQDGGNFEVGIYTEEGNNRPATLLEGVSRTNSMVGSGWERVTGLNIPIDAETTYWIGLQVDGTFSYDATNGGTKTDRKDSQTTLPSSWGTSDNTWSRTISLYAVWEEAPAGVTRKIKISGTFQDKPIKTKVAGTFEDKVIKIKVGGTFQDA